MDRTQTWTPQLRAHADRLLGEGYGVKTIALELGLDATVVLLHHIESTDLALVCARWMAEGGRPLFPIRHEIARER